MINSVISSGVGSPYGFTIDTRTEWASTTAYDEGETAYYLNTTYTNMSDFAGYDGSFRIPELRAIQGASWWFWNDKNVYFIFEFTQANNQSHRILVWVNIWSHEQTFGTVIQQNIQSCVRVDEYQEDFDYKFGNTTLEGHGEVRIIKHSAQDTWDLNGGYFKVVIAKVNETSASLGVYNYQSPSMNLCKLFEADIIVNNGFFNNTIPFLTILHDGHGEFHAYSILETLYTGSSPSLPVSSGERRVYSWYDGVTSMFASVVNILPDWLRNWVSGFGVWFTFAYKILDVVWSMALQFLPLLPFLFLGYFLDVIYTSFTRGSIEPIGIFAMGIYNTVSSVIGTLIGIASVVYQYIKFW